MFADFSEEKKLWEKGCEFVVGLDEVGRGPLAGPVMAAAVTVRQFPISSPRLREGEAGNFQFLNKLKIQRSKKLIEIKDSKKLTERQRNEWYDFLTTHPEVKWGVGIVSAQIIDRVNILEATKLAMKEALKNLKAEPDFLLLDGNFLLEDLPISQKAVTRGDEKIWSCAAASIIAKVTRDRLMKKYDVKYPEYGFKKHKGYGTKQHLAAIKEHGACPIHRLSFAPFS